MNNYLRGTRVYLAGQLEHGDPDFVKSWRSYVTKELTPLNITTISPLDPCFITFKAEDKNFRDEMYKALQREDYNLVRQEMKSIRRRDLGYVDLCNFLFVVLDADKPSAGLWEETFQAVRENKPIFFVVQQGKKRCPYWLFGAIPHEWIYSSIDEALGAIKKLDDGSIPLNEKYWRIFSPAYQTNSSRIDMMLL